MDAILPPAPHPAATAPASATPAPWQQDRIARLATLTPQDAIAGLLWLAMNYPAACDAMLDKLDYDAIDDPGPGPGPDPGPDPGREPAPCCAQCGADIGIFLRDGQHWQHYTEHYTGDGTSSGSIEVFDPGHRPVIAWCLPRVPAGR